MSKRGQRAARGTPLPTLIVIAVAVVASLLCLRNQFAQDDLSIIVQSDRLHGFGDWHSILMLPYWPLPATPDLYRPLTSLWLATQYTIGDGAAGVFHLTSVLLYALSAVAVFRLASRLLSPGAALSAAVLFAAHPVHVEAVALAVTQNELLVCLVVCAAVRRYVDRRNGAGLRAIDWSLFAICFALSAFLKEQGFLFPLFLLIAEATLVRGQRMAARIGSIWEGYAVLLAVGTFSFAARTTVLHGHVGPGMIAEALRGQTMGGRMLTMLRVVPEWARLLLWPAHLRADYAPQEFVASTGLGPRELLGLAILLLSVTAIVVAWKRFPVVSFGLLWTVVALLPVSNVFVPTGILIAERTLFLASAGFLLALVSAVVSIPAAVGWSDERRRDWMGAAAAIAACAAILGVGRSLARYPIWRDNRALTAASLVDSPRSWHVHEAYGEELFDDRDPSTAVAEFQRAIQLAPEPWRIRNRFAQRLRLVNADAAALDQLEQSAREAPAEIESRAQMVPALLALGQYKEGGRLADSIIRATGGPDVMLWLRHVADSADHVKAPAGSIRIGLGER